LIAGIDESVDPIYSLLKSAAGLPSARTPASSSKSPPAAASAIADVQPPTSDGTRSKNDGGGGGISGSGAQFHRSNSGSPHKSQSPHQRLQQQQRKLPPVLHLPGMPIIPHVMSGVLLADVVLDRRLSSC